MKKIIFRSGLLLAIYSFIIALTGMSLTSNTNNCSTRVLADDSLRTIDNFQVSLLKDETIEVEIGDWSYFYSQANPNYKKGDNQRISTSDYELNLNNQKVINQLKIPEELNFYNSKSTTSDLYSLCSFSLSKYSLFGYTNYSWWLAFVESKVTLTPYNDENPNNYIMNKDADGTPRDERMMNIFHTLMKNKLAREVLYNSIKENYNLIDHEISALQKRILIKEINHLTIFCENYSANRKKYLNGRVAITEKPGDYDFGAEYGYETSNEGFIFRRIEFDGVPPLELAQFLKDFQKTIIASLTSSDFNSHMSCEINGGKLKVNSYANSKNKIGFLLRTNNNNGFYFIPSQKMKVTKLEINGKGYWRILYDDGNIFITLDENLKKFN
jgi:hypothetical protein